MVENLIEVFQRLGKVEAEMEQLEKVWRSSVDDIKATIKSEIGDLKREQIGDLKQAIKDRDQNMAAYELRMRDVENALRDWATSSGLVGYLVKTAIAIGGVLAGAFGWEHLRR